MRNEKGQFIKGSNPYPETQFKKGVGGEKSGHWKGGRRRSTQGYILIYCPDHPRAYRNEMCEHIVIAEKKIGRYLQKGENVHHINGIKDDNRIENLIVLSSSEHSKLHSKDRRNGRKTYIAWNKGIKMDKPAWNKGMKLCGGKFLLPVF